MAAIDDARLDDALREASAAAAAVAGQGRVARYIPELAAVDPDRFALAVALVDGRTRTVGDCDHRFTLQSASKVFALAAVMQASGHAVFDRVGIEPSGDAFFSIVKLEEERGRPRNPYINAGAILVTEALPGPTAFAKVASLQAFLGEVTGDGPDAFPVDHTVYRSEAATGHRNRALAEIMTHHGVIADPDLATDAYFRQCAVTVSPSQLARAGVFLAARGRDPGTGRAILAPGCARTVVALMATSGMYDEVGRQAVEVGWPTKSAVSGALLAVMPGVGAFAAFSPRLGAKGNSVAGMAALKALADKLDLSLFGGGQ